MAVAEAICFSMHQLSRMGKEPRDMSQAAPELVYTHKVYTHQEEMESREEKQEFLKILIECNYFLYVCSTAVPTLYVVVYETSI